MKNETLNALILHYGDRMLRQAGWPDAIDMAPVEPEIVPGWLAACGSLSGTEILTLTEQLCQPLTYGRAALLLASARREPRRVCISFRCRPVRILKSWLTVRLEHQGRATLPFLPAGAGGLVR